MKNKTKVISIVLSFSVFFIFVSYQKQKAEWKGAIEEVDGVTLVKNPKEPMYGEDALQLEEDLAITSPDDEDLYFQNLNYLVVDDAENIYVSDSKAGYILVFDKSGEFMRKIGRRGQGPGEMIFPLEIQILGKNELFVNDTGQAKAHIFTLGGDFLRQITTSKIPAFRLPKADSVGNIVVCQAIPGEPFKFVLKKIDSELNTICEVTSSVAITQPPVIDFFEMRWRTTFVWNVSKNNEIIWGNFNKYEISVCDPDGNCIRKIVKEHDGASITKEDKQTLIKGYFGNNPVPPSITLKFPDQYPSFIYLTCDEEGRIFALSYVKTDDDEKRYLDVFDSEGKYIVRTKTKSFPQIWKNGMMYCVGEDADGFEVIRRYKVNWKY